MRGRLLLSCPDAPGIVAAVASSMAERSLNIVDLDQHAGSDRELHMRLVFEGEFDLEALEAGFAGGLGAQLRARASFADAGRRRRVMLFASAEGHCLLDQLWRFSSGELPGEVAGVISNHPDLRERVADFGIAYHEVPNEPDGREEAERRMLGLCREAGAELIVLARYMRVLTASFLDGLGGTPAINIHHSFLPAFPGSGPYAQAHARGVKVIGATAHYVTPELDAGPIIAQDTRAVSHRDEVADLVRIGRDLERVVLAEAVRAELEDRILLAGERTIVF